MNEASIKFKSKSIFQLHQQSYILQSILDLSKSTPHISATLLLLYFYDASIEDWNHSKIYVTCYAANYSATAFYSVLYQVVWVYERVICYQCLLILSSPTLTQLLPPPSPKYTGEFYGQPTCSLYSYYITIIFSIIVPLFSRGITEIYRSGLLNNLSQTINRWTIVANVSWTKLDCQNVWIMLELCRIIMELYLEIQLYGKY